MLASTRLFTYTQSVMYTYSYDGLQPQSKSQAQGPGFLGNIGQRFSSHTPSHETVKRHVVFLMLQAVFIMSLAVFSMYAELRANVAEADTKNLEIQQHLLVQSRKENDRISQNSAVLGAQNADGTARSTNSETSDDIRKNTDGTLPESAQPAQDEYVIAVYGDSMVDTMGEVLEYMDHDLKEKYPNTRFNLYNYGMGSNNTDDGLLRWEKPFHHMDRNYPPITEIEPDIIIMGSFAYNVFTPHNRDKHWLGLTELVQRSQRLTPNVYILAEIAPMRRGFGFGPNGVNWEPATAYAHTGNIIEQLKNAIGLSETLQVPLIDAYTPSLEEDREEGKRQYVNPSDGIHPSVAGHQFMAEIIIEALQLK